MPVRVGVNLGNQPVLLGSSAEVKIGGLSHGRRESNVLNGEPRGRTRLQMDGRDLHDFGTFMTMLDSTIVNIALPRSPTCSA